MDNQNSINRLRRILLLLTVSCFIFAVGVFVFTLTNSCTLQVKLPPNGRLFINDVEAKEDTYRGRSGKLHITILSPRYARYTKDVSVRYKQTLVLTPKYTERDQANVVSSVIGAYSTYGAPGVTDGEWVDNDSWFVGVLGPGSPAPIAIHYDSSGAKVAYYEITGYPSDIQTLPQDIQKLINVKKALYANQ